jgi:hypothetical protein
VGKLSNMSLFSYFQQTLFINLTSEVGMSQVGMSQVGMSQVGMSQVGMSQFDMNQVGASKFTQAFYSIQTSYDVDKLNKTTIFNWEIFPKDNYTHPEHPDNYSNP